MSFLQDWLATPLARDMGWVFLHFLWQGALVGVVFAIALAVLRERRAETRYLASCIALCALVALPLATFLFVSSGQPSASLAGVRDSLPAISMESRWQAVLPLLCAFWCLGSIFLQFRMLLQWVWAQRLRYSGASTIPAPWARTVSEMCTELGIKRRVSIVLSSLASVPAVVGWLSPVVLVPVGALTRLSTDELRAVLAHELAHVRRHDYAINLLQAVVESLLFFHPVVWWVSDRLRTEREYCCDDVAVELCGDALGYARALSTLETLRSDDGQLAMASTGGPLMNRIRRLLRIENPKNQRLSRGVLPAAGALFASLVATTAIGMAAPQDQEVHSRHRVRLTDDSATTDIDRQIAELQQRINRLQELIARETGQAQGDRPLRVRRALPGAEQEVHLRWGSPQVGVEAVREWVAPQVEVKDEWHAVREHGVWGTRAPKAVKESVGGWYTTHEAPEPSPEPRGQWRRAAIDVPHAEAPEARVRLYTNEAVPMPKGQWEVHENEAHELRFGLRTERSAPPVRVRTEVRDGKRHEVHYDVRYEAAPETLPEPHVHVKEYVHPGELRTLWSDHQVRVSPDRRHVEFDVEVQDQVQDQVQEHLHKILREHLSDDIHDEVMDLLHQHLREVHEHEARPEGVREPDRRAAPPRASVRRIGNLQAPPVRAELQLLPHGLNATREVVTLLPPIRAELQLLPGEVKHAGVPILSSIPTIGQLFTEETVSVQATVNTAPLPISVRLIEALERAPDCEVIECEPVPDCDEEPEETLELIGELIEIGK